MQDGTRRGVTFIILPNYCKEIITKFVGRKGKRVETQC